MGSLDIPRRSLNDTLSSILKFRALGPEEEDKAWLSSASVLAKHVVAHQKETDQNERRHLPHYRITRGPSDSFRPARA